MCENFIQAPFLCAIPMLYIFFIRTHVIHFFSTLGANPYKSEHQQSNSTLTNNA